MGRTWMVGMLVVTAVAARGPRHAETPRATDLLRARKLAEQKEELLRLPRPPAPGWLQGGSGWGDRGDRARKPKRRSR